MKIIINKVTTLLCISVFLMGADCSNRTLEYEIGPFIVNYAHVDEIILRYMPISNSKGYPPSISINMDWPIYQNIYSHFDDKEKKAQYERYSKKYNDVGNCNIKFKSQSSFNRLLRLSFIESIDQIEVSCDRDFDAQHPKGSLLNDCFTLVGLSPLKFIQSHYTEGYNWDADQNCPRYIKNYMLTDSHPFNGARHAIHPIIKPLVDLNPGDLELCGGYLDRGADLDCVLFFNSLPEVLGVYTFTVKVTLSDGRELEASIAYDLTEASI